MENYNYLSFILLKDDPRVMLEVIDKLEDLGVKFDLDEERNEFKIRTYNFLNSKNTIDTYNYFSIRTLSSNKIFYGNYYFYYLTVDEAVEIRMNHFGEGKMFDRLRLIKDSGSEYFIRNLNNFYIKPSMVCNLNSFYIKSSMVWNLNKYTGYFVKLNSIDYIPVSVLDKNDIVIAFDKSCSLLIKDKKKRYINALFDGLFVKRPDIEEELLKRLTIKSVL